MSGTVADRASALLAAGRANEAVKLLRTSGEELTTDARAWVVLARAHLSLQEPQEALEATDRALALSPMDVDGLRFRASALSDLGLHRNAIETARMAIAAAPRFPGGFITLAQCQLDARDTDAALTSALTAVDLGPSWAPSHALAGRIALAAGDLDLAQEHLEICLRLDPQDASALNNLAVVNMRRADFASASEQFRDAVRLTGDDLMASNLVRAEASHRFQQKQRWLKPLVTVGLGLSFVAFLLFANPWPGILLSAAVIVVLAFNTGDPTRSWGQRFRSAGRTIGNNLPVSVLVLLWIVIALFGPPELALLIFATVFAIRFLRTRRHLRR